MGVLDDLEQLALVEVRVGEDQLVEGVGVGQDGRERLERPEHRQVAVAPAAS